MDTAIWIIIAVIAVIAVLALVLLLLRQRKARRRVQAEQIRQNASQQVSTVRHREAVAEEADARARQAKAEADAKAAEAKRLQEQARHHQGHAAESRHEVESEFARADKLDPDVRRTGDGHEGHDPAGQGRHEDQQQPGVGGHRPDPRSHVDPRRDQTPPNAR
ncbi:hypothetical protein [Gordonia sp. 'Campus']|uniref:hypothetical protein n=1 Tax=Gordonia sp. 'Campus' TaxID=2915824 RepID=UPI001EE43198|nr:hypothetical protein [Gordonia sp. 'Campus']